MLDSDLAALYQVETGALNRAAKRNEGRFPEDFRFQLTQEEYEALRCQLGISWDDQRKFGSGGRRYMPYAYTEQGVAMLSAAPAETPEPGQPTPNAREGRIALSYTIGGMINAVQSNGDMPPAELEDALAHLLSRTLQPMQVKHCERK